MWVSEWTHNAAKKPHNEQCIIYCALCSAIMSTTAESACKPNSELKTKTSKKSSIICLKTENRDRECQSAAIRYLLMHNKLERKIHSASQFIHWFKQSRICWDASQLMQKQSEWNAYKQSNKYNNQTIVNRQQYHAKRSRFAFSHYYFFFFLQQYNDMWSSTNEIHQIAFHLK